MTNTIVRPAVGRYWNDAAPEEAERLADFLAACGKPLTQVALAWVLALMIDSSTAVGDAQPQPLNQAMILRLFFAFERGL